MVEDMGFARSIVDACEDHITYEDRCIAVRDILARHRIAAEQRSKLEGARLAIEAISLIVHDQDRETVATLSPAKIVGEG